MHKYNLQRALAGCALLLSLVLVAAVGSAEQLQSFNAKDLDGNDVDLGEIVGRQPVMLVFWASWCPTCKQEMPRVNRFAKALGPKGMRFIAVNVGYNDSPVRAQAFKDKYEMNYPVVFDKSGEISRSFGVQGVPTIIIARQDGSVVYRGYEVPDSLIEDYPQLLKR